MSGFEIAGVVLGAFPILCDTAKDLGTVFKKTKWWWQFETSFENFVSTIATQEIAYILVLERLLGPLDITEAEYDSLLGDPKSNLWHESHIQEELRQCLPHSKYTWFMWNLSDLNTAIEELQKLLPIDKVHRLDSTNLESELFRLQTSFSSDKDRLLKRITQVNDDLHQFFDRGATVIRPSATKPSIPFRDLHHQAVTFYECLARRWKCSCSSAHTVGIAVHPAVQKPSRMAEHGYFNVLFKAEASFKQLRLQVETLTTSKYETNSDSVAPEKAVKLEAAIDLKSQIMVKKQLKSVSNAANENSVSTLAIASLSISGHGIQTPQRSILRKAANKLKKVQRWNRVDSSPDETQHNASARPNSILSLSTTCVSESTATLTNEPSLRVPSEGNQLLRSRSSASCTSRVRFDEAGLQPSPIEVAEVLNGEVFNICDFVKGSNTLNGDGNSTLSLDEGQRIVLKPEPLNQSTINASTSQSIDSFIKMTTVRQSRLYVGLSLALTLLCLATSSWVPTQLAKDDIFLVCCESGGKPSSSKRFGPYFSRTSQDICSSSSSSSSPPVDSRTWNAKSSLLLLGVVLLELFHGQKLEQQEAWAESLDEDGQPNESTRLCGAFLWICRAKESLQTHFGSELGGELSEAIRKCICFDFGRDDDYGDSRLAEVVYREVVVPLEKCCPSI
ncbi:hypothetical protein CDEST_08336 [Colletotrichum destructivum]|uniref:DUF7580 domain-containing protein n=1 Tax=Colletotrichum destructivum TaxID=34406 RepID=A0AAX4IIR7_9PEZI|nr:hypothetical protein CDEST_08336 [Colletotrichum destructivum]